MAKQRSSFAKLQRDRAKAAKRAAKLANKGTSPAVPEPHVPATTPLVDESRELTSVAQLFEGKDELTAPELLEMIEEVHRMKERGDLTQEEFEDAKVEIFARLPIE